METTETYPVRPVTLYVRLVALLFLATLLTFAYLHKTQLAEQQARFGTSTTTIAEIK